jgi:hypothetical protein
MNNIEEFISFFLIQVVFIVMWATFKLLIEVVTSLILAFAQILLKPIFEIWVKDG